MEAEFVRRIVQQGTPNTVDASLRSMINNTEGVRTVRGKRTVKGVRKKMIGMVMAADLKQFKTPKRLARGGKKRNWAIMPAIPIMV